MKAKTIGFCFLFILFCPFAESKEQAPMKKSEQQFVHVELSVERDLGHGGERTTYKLERKASNYEITVTRERLFPKPGERGFRPTQEVSKIIKDPEAINLFLNHIVKHPLYDIKPRHPLLHPTVYTFLFRDVAGNQMQFKYTIEGDHHFDKHYEAFIKQFENFFNENKKEMNKKTSFLNLSPE